jgi:hypothetical protein
VNRHSRVALLILSSLLAGSLLTARDGIPARAATPVVDRDKVGVSFTGDALGWSDARLRAELDNVRGMGASWVRVPFNWATLQMHGRGTYNWPPSDRIVTEARKRKLRVMPVVSYTPEWARPNGTPPTQPPTNPDDYAAFLFAAARRYAPQGVHRWEIWNEPNLFTMWTPTPSVNRYTKLLRATYPVLKAADPKAVVITGGLSPAWDAPNHSQISPYTFLANIYRYGGKGSFDQVGLHPSSFPWRSSTDASWNPMKQAKRMYALMKYVGDGRKRMTATEIGFPTGTSPRAVTETEQGPRFVEGISIWHSYSFSAPIFVYAVRDEGSDISNHYHNFGVVRHDGTRKPSWYVLRTALTGN